MPKELPAISLYLRFYGESFDPSCITKRLGIAPTSSYRAGEIAKSEADVPKKRELRHRRDGWYLKVGPRETIQIHELIQELRESIGPATTAVKELCDDLNIEAVVLCGVLQPVLAPAPALRFSPEFLRWIADMGATLDVDVILSE